MNAVSYLNPSISFLGEHAGGAALSDDQLSKSLIVLANYKKDREREKYVCVCMCLSYV